MKYFSPFAQSVQLQLEKKKLQTFVVRRDAVQIAVHTYALAVGESHPRCSESSHSKIFVNKSAIKLKNLAKISHTP